jgi:selenocysteine-specific elongation factor
MEPVTFDALRTRSEMDGGLVREVVERQIDEAAMVMLNDGQLNDSSVLATAAGFEALAGKAVAITSEFVAEHPLRSGILMEELRSRLKLPGKAFAGLERRLVDDGQLASTDGSYDLPNRSVTLSPEQDAQVSHFLGQLKASGSKPSSAESIDPELAIYLQTQGLIVRAAEGLYFDAAIHASMVEQVVAAIRENERITLAEVRDMFGTSRKIAQGFLEDMDRRRITRRVGDARILRVG